MIHSSQIHHKKGQLPSHVFPQQGSSICFLSQKDQFPNYKRVTVVSGDCLILHPSYLVSDLEKENVVFIFNSLQISFISLPPPSLLFFTSFQTAPAGNDDPEIFENDEYLN